MPLSRKLWTALLGAAAVIIALTLAVSAAGPSLRAVLGPPTAYNSDVTSPDAYRQAVAAQIICVSVALFALGLTLGRWTALRHWRSAVWTANPLTVSVGYWVFRQMSSASVPYEFRAYHGWLVLTLLSPFMLAPCVCLGARLRRHGA